MRAGLTTRWGHAFGVLLGILVILGHSAAFAQEAEEEDESFEQKVIKGILGGLGVDVGQSRSIDYRERSPLVIPPNTDLPPPETAAANPPDWPKDPELRPKRRVSHQKRDPNGSVRQYEAERASLSPAELKGGTKPGTDVPTPPSQPIDNTQDVGGRPLPESALGGVTSWVSDLLSNGKAEEKKFPGEPRRTDLTDPPPGYQIPSSSYPYGVGGGAKKGPSTLEMPQTTDRAASDTTGGK